MVTATTLALFAAILEATTCPYALDTAKLHKMVRYTVHFKKLDQGPDSYFVRAQLLDIGAHAARYACKKKVKLGRIDPLASPKE